MWTDKKLFNIVMIFQFIYIETDEKSSTVFKIIMFNTFPLGGGGGGVQYISLPRTTNLAYLDAKE